VCSSHATLFKTRFEDALTCIKCDGFPRQTIDTRTNGRDTGFRKDHDCCQKQWLISSCSWGDQGGKATDEENTIPEVSNIEILKSIAGKLSLISNNRLGKSGLKVSRIILGCMSFGSPTWTGSPWVLPPEAALPLLKKAYDHGIYTWDTANTYSNGASEAIIGTALKKYSIPRSRVVILTKLYYPVLEGSDARPQPAENGDELANQMGLSRKHIFDAVDGSLRRLQTDYIDVLQLHRLDRETEPEEIMRALHDLVRLGRVRYLGASSMRAWEFVRLQYTAKINGWTEFVSMQGLYNLLYREEEREMNPFCEAEGVGLIPWSPLARGLLCRPVGVGSERSEQDVKSKKWFKGSMDGEIIERIERVARRRNCSMTAVATAWLLSKGCAPIVGLGSEKRIEEAVEAFDVELTGEDVLELEEMYESVSVVGM
jgi:aryl-alcohol dehydrogenase-like predicted oxidoreductase